MQAFTFTSQLLNEAGRRVGLRAKTARLSDEGGLDFGKVVVPLEAIDHAEVLSAERHVALHAGEHSCVFLVFKKSPARVVREINAAASRAHAEATRRRLREQGEAAAYRETACPHCEATIELSHMPETPQVFCRYCEKLSETGADNAERGVLAYCQGCGLFGDVKRWNEFYFVFLGVFMAWRVTKHKACHNCVQRKVWRTVVINALTLIGLPHALYNLTRLYASGLKRSKAFQRLGVANAATTKNDHLTAQREYEQLLAASPNEALVHFNLAGDLLREDSPQRAAEQLELALASAANFGPAAGLLADIYANTGQTQKAKEVLSMFDVVIEDDELEEQAQADEQVLEPVGV